VIKIIFYIANIENTIYIYLYVETQSYYISRLLVYQMFTYTYKWYDNIYIYMCFQTIPNPHNNTKFLIIDNLYMRIIISYCRATRKLDNFGQYNYLDNAIIIFFIVNQAFKQFIAELVLVYYLILCLELIEHFSLQLFLVFLVENGLILK